MAFIVVILGGMGSIPRRRRSGGGAASVFTERLRSAPSTVRRPSAFPVVRLSWIALLVVRPVGNPGKRREA